MGPAGEVSEAEGTAKVDIQRWKSAGRVEGGRGSQCGGEQCEDDGVRKPGGGVRGLPSPAQWSPTSHAQDVHQPIVKQPLLKIKLN